jgi:hypothetical protein
MGSGARRTDDDEGNHFLDEMVMYRYEGNGQPPTEVKRTRTVTGTRKRRYDQFRTGPCYLFPVANIPEPMVHLPSPDPSNRETGLYPNRLCPRGTTIP